MECLFLQSCAHSTSGSAVTQPSRMRHCRLVDVYQESNKEPCMEGLGVWKAKVTLASQAALSWISGAGPGGPWHHHPNKQM